MWKGPTTAPKDANESSVEIFIPHQGRSVYEDKDWNENTCNRATRSKTVDAKKKPLCMHMLKQQITKKYVTKRIKFDWNVILTFLIYMQILVFILLSETEFSKVDKRQNIQKHPQCQRIG